MTNEEIIFDVACQQIGEEKATFFLEQDGEVPFHTFEGWKKRGKCVKRGEKGIPTRLWRKRDKKSKNFSENETEDENENDGFYLCKAFLFSYEQVENFKKKEV